MTQANKILLKRSTIGTDVTLYNGGSGAQKIVVGELAINYATGKLYYQDNTGAIKWFAADGSGTVKLNSILAADGANSIGSGDNAQVWNWLLSTPGKSAFTFGESGPSTGSGSALVNIATVASSLASPLVVSAGGTKAFQVFQDGTVVMGAVGSSTGGYISVTGSTGAVQMFGLDSTSGASASVGAGTGTTGAGGALQLTAGNSASGDGGQVDITAGTSAATGNGGSLVLTTGSGVHAGNFTVQMGTGGGVASFNLNASDTFVVKNVSGTGLKVDGYNNVFAGVAGVTTNTDGYFFIPEVSGTPTGVPAHGATGFAPIVFDSSTNKLWAYDNTGTPGWYAAGGGGTVTSVALTAPSSVFTVTGSPVTSAGTLAISFQTQTANTIFAGPTTGAAAAPTFRAIVSADLPSTITSNTTGNAATATLAVAATNVAGGTAGQVPYQSAASTTAFAGPGTAGQVLTSNGATAPTFTSVVNSVAGGTGISVSSATGAVTITNTGVTSFQTSLAGLSPSTSTTGAVTLSGTLGAASGGTGVNNGTNTMTFAGNVNFAGAFPVTLTSTASTSLTLPTSGTILVNTNIGSTVQAHSASLDALAALPGNGLVIQTGTNTFTNTAITTSGTGLSVANGDGVAGAPTISVTHNLAAIEGLTGEPGFVVFTADGVATLETITGTAGEIVVTNGNGVGGTPTISLDTIGTPVSNSFVNITTDTFGRVSATSAVTAGQVETLLGGYYLPTAGGTMTGNIAMGTHSITGLADPVNPQDAATKNYVDNAVSGLTWKDAVAVATTTAGTLSSSFTAGTVIDGVTLTLGMRILIKNQVSGTENGIYIVTAGTPTRATDMALGSTADNSAVFVNGGTVNANTGWVETANPAVVGTNALVFAQFSGAGAYSAGTGLLLSGSTFSFDVGSGLTAGATTGDSNAIGVKVYTPSSGALILTTDGSARSTAASAGLSLLLASGGGLVQDGTGLYIGAGDVSNAMLTNSSFVVDADTGTGALALGDTFKIFGASAQGISTNVAVTGTGPYVTTYTVTASDASSSQKGVASFDATNFTVTSGNVVIATGGVSNAELQNDSISFAGTTGGAQAVALGATLSIVGGSSPITTVSSAGQVAINIADATVSSKGLASFNPSYFTVTSGAVSWNTSAALTVASLTAGSITDSGLTANSFMYSGVGGLLSSTTAPTNGQLLIGSTGGAPVAGTITGSTGLSVTLGAGTIALANTGVTSITTTGAGLTALTGATGAVSFSNTGVTSLAAGTGISLTGTTGAITVTNTGVTSVALATGDTATGNVLAVTGSPVTTTGTLTVTLQAQAANTVFAGAASGGLAEPTFRTLSLAQGDLSDVDTTGVADGYFLTYVASASKWEVTNTVDGGTF